MLLGNSSNHRLGHLPFKWRIGPDGNYTLRLLERLPNLKVTFTRFNVHRDVRMVFPALA
jgi:hypothetical protein